MPILVTGAAGFIGFHVSRALLARGQEVVGLDNLNDYYDPALKAARLAKLESEAGFRFARLDLADRAGVAALFAETPGITGIVHLAAQAGVRHSLIDPYAYVDANVMGSLVMLEEARRLEGLEHFVYASSSSVYGGNTKLPFAVEDRVDSPVSLYAATKKAAELMGHCYAHLFGIPATGLRFFTVYGPWGRPDMSAYIFTKAILAGEPITLFNGGDMGRDFTYIDDIVAGVLAALDAPPPAGEGVRHRVYNLGNHRAERLENFVATIEAACGKAAVKRFAEMQPGDVKETYADIEAARRDLGFEPKTSIAEGIPRFVAWFKDYHGIAE